MVEPLIAATQIFDHMQQPDLPRVEQVLNLLLDHYDFPGVTWILGYLRILSRTSMHGHFSMRIPEYADTAVCAY